MKILFITHHYLSDNSGGSFASRAYINAFAEIADEMTLLYPIKEEQNLFDGINPKIKAIPVEYAIPKWCKLIHALTGKVHRYFEATSEFLCEKKADIVVFDTSIVSFRVIDKFKAKGYKTIVIHHNYQYEYFRDNVKGFLKPITLLWCKKYEGEAVRKADVNLTLTQQDVELLANNYNSGNRTNFSVLGTFEYRRREHKNILTEGLEKHYRFVITGSLSSYQTYASLGQWIKDYYPLLKSVFRESTLTIAGKNPSAELVELCNNNGVHVVPSPPNMDDVLKNVDYYICPTFLGGGLKLRIMDGLKWGLPVVTHAVSARGYDAFKDAGCLFAYSGNEDFILALQELKNISMTRQQIQNLYESVFSFNAGMVRLNGILVSLEKQC
ncbi:MAG: glycosyltransferase [Paludibacteraceae bacterium]|nr:glycosyltransferase [Paludibacteraceae bacterium]